MRKHSGRSRALGSLPTRARGGSAFAVGTARLLALKIDPGRMGVTAFAVLVPAVFVEPLLTCAGGAKGAATFVVTSCAYRTPLTQRKRACRECFIRAAGNLWDMNSKNGFIS